MQNLSIAARCPIANARMQTPHSSSNARQGKIMVHELKTKSFCIPLQLYKICISIFHMKIYWITYTMSILRDYTYALFVGVYRRGETVEKVRSQWSSSRSGRVWESSARSQKDWKSDENISTKFTKFAGNS